MTAPYIELADMLAHEARLMGRPVKYINMQENTFKDPGGKEHTSRFLVYDASTETHPQTRYALYINGRCEVGGIFT